MQVANLFASLEGDSQELFFFFCKHYFLICLVRDVCFKTDVTTSHV